MSKDISTILEGWDHDPDELQVRIILGLDGQDKLQMRLDLGLLQMELRGRPDGKRPHGYESLLDYHEARMLEANTEESYTLDADACSELMREGVQYYHRYLALFHLGRYDLVAADTTRNLRLFSFVTEHATRKADKLAFDQYRPYVTMMRARALGMQAVEREEYRNALKHIDEGIRGIEAFLRDYGQLEKASECQELMFLRQWRDEVKSKNQGDPIERLEEQLQHVVAREDYEEAARIRDQIRRLRFPATGEHFPS